MKALVYGGAFNPPTAAHIDLAEFAMHKTGSECVVYVPSKSVYIHDDQGKNFAFSDQERVDMLKKVAETHPWMRVSTYEIDSETQPRTYETLCYLRDHEGYQGKLLFGSDKLVELETNWKYVDEICNEFGIVCMERCDDICEEIIDFDPFLRAHKDSITVLMTPEKYRFYSSSRIREILSRDNPDKGELYRLLPPELYYLAEGKGPYEKQNV